MAAAFPSSSLAPPSAHKMLMLEGAGSAAGGRLVVLHRAGAAAGAGRVLLLGPAKALVAVAGGATARLVRCTGGGGEQWSSSDSDSDGIYVYEPTATPVVVGAVVAEDKKLMHELASLSKDSQNLLDLMMKKAPAPLGDVVQEGQLGAVKMAFVRVEDECSRGYVTGSAVEGAMDGLITMAELFVGSRVAEALRPRPNKAGVSWIAIDDEGEAAFLYNLASAFSDMLYRVKTAYAEVALQGGRGDATDKQLPGSLDDLVLDKHNVKLLVDALTKLCVGVVLPGDEKVLGDIATVAKEAKALLDMWMMNEPPNPLFGLLYKDLVLANATFLIVESQAALGYVTSSALEAAPRALKSMVEVFVGIGAAEALGHADDDVIDFTAATEEEKAAQVRHLATRFSDLLQQAKVLYADRAQD